MEPSQTEPALERWPVRIDVPVAWGDMDAFGHVNNAVYLRWFESARIAYFERAGMLERMKREGLGPILARATVDYRAPVTWPDTVTVSATVARLGITSYVMKYRATSRAANDAVVAEGESVIVMYDYRASKKAPIDEPLRQAIHTVERSAAS